MEEQSVVLKNTDQIKEVIHNACLQGPKEALLLQLISLTPAEAALVTYDIACTKYQAIFNQLLIAIVKQNHLCCLKVLKLLIALGADINTTDENGFTPLIWAINNHNKPLVNEILNLYANVNKQDAYGYTAFHYACFASNEEITFLVFDKLTKAALLTPISVTGSKATSYTLFHFICEHASKEKVIYLLRHLPLKTLDALKQLPHPAEWQPLALNALLIDAAKYNGVVIMSAVQALRLFLELGADVNAVEDGSFTALLWTVINGNQEAVHFLCGQQANTNLTDVAAYTPLDFARLLKLDEIATILSEHGAKASPHGAVARIEKTIISTEELAVSASDNSAEGIQPDHRLSVSTEFYLRFNLFYHPDRPSHQSIKRNSEQDISANHALPKKSKISLGAT